MIKWARRCFPPPRSSGAERRIEQLERQVSELTHENIWLTSERLRITEQRKHAHMALSLVVHAMGGRVEITPFHILEMGASAYEVETHVDERTGHQVFTTPAPR